jgi:hypothetical protein
MHTSMWYWDVHVRTLSLLFLLHLGRMRDSSDGSDAQGLLSPHFERFLPKVLFQPIFIDRFNLFVSQFLLLYFVIDI